MFKIKSKEYLKDMGFKLDSNGLDYVYKTRAYNVSITIFTVYKGTLILRYPQTSRTVEPQLKCIYNWTNKGYIEWEEE